MLLPLRNVIGHHPDSPHVGSNLPAFRWKGRQAMSTILKWSHNTPGETRRWRVGSTHVASQFTWYLTNGTQGNRFMWMEGGLGTERKEILTSGASYLWCLKQKKGMLVEKWRPDHLVLDVVFCLFVF
jgi:hypothetical protein